LINFRIAITCRSRTSSN